MTEVEGSCSPGVMTGELISLYLGGSRSQTRDLGHPSLVSDAVSWGGLRILPGSRPGVLQTRTRELAGGRVRVRCFALPTCRRCFRCRKLPSPRVLDGPEYPYRKATSMSSVLGQESVDAYRLDKWLEP